MEKVYEVKQNLEKKLVSKDQLKALIALFHEKNEEAFKLEIEESRKIPFESEEDRKHFEELIRESYQVTGIITTHSGEQTYVGADPDDLDIYLDSEIRSLHFDNVAAYRVRRNDLLPRNGFIVFLDFRRQPLLAWDLVPSAPTINESNLHIRGLEKSWVDSVKHGIENKFVDRYFWPMFIHKPFAWDFTLFIFAFPLSFYALSLLNDYNFVDKITQNTIIQVGIYFYLFLLILNIIRVFHGYTRWAFPVIEIDSSRNIVGMHRKIWYGLASGLVVASLAKLI